MLKITKRTKDLPKGFFIPNQCQQCGIYKGFDPASSFTWVTDGKEIAVGFCSNKCAKKYLALIDMEILNGGL